MADPWTYAGPVARTDSSSGAITLVDESTFAISGGAGDISGGAQGLFFRDTRIVSTFEMLVDGRPTEPLAAVSDDPFSSTFVSRCPPSSGRADSTLMVFRSRYVGQGMREDLTIRNFGDGPAACTVELLFAADFADLFAVKEGRVPMVSTSEGTTSSVHATYASGAPAATVAISHHRSGVDRGVEVLIHGPAEVHPGVARPMGSGRRVSSFLRSSKASASTLGTAAASLSIEPPRLSAWPSGGARCLRWRPTIRA